MDKIEKIQDTLPLGNSLSFVSILLMQFSSLYTMNQGIIQDTVFTNQIYSKNNTQNNLKASNDLVTETKIATSIISSYPINVNNNIFQSPALTNQLTVASILGNINLSQGKQIGMLNNNSTIMVESYAKIEQEKEKIWEEFKNSLPDWIESIRSENIEKMSSHTCDAPMETEQLNKKLKDDLISFKKNEETLHGTSEDREFFIEFLKQNLLEEEF